MTPLITIKVPDAVVYGNFLSATECAELIAHAEGHMQFSKVVDRASGKAVLHEARTSSSMFLKRGQNDLVTCIEQRISNVTGLPVENGEGMQILRYDVGQEYRKHYDYFNPDRETTPHHIKRGGQRIATFLMYLNTPDGVAKQRSLMRVYPYVQTKGTHYFSATIHQALLQKHCTAVNP